ncbi:MAG TPA: YcxB family protein [Phycisphaerae bacterium]|nr:YcxB family protein [Phycisphaerales bacterium]HRX85257.1 YcxB family protein [Phycisphaerae bacterium]
MRLRFVLTQDDAINAQLLLIDHEPTVRRAVRKARWVTALALLAVGIPFTLMTTWTGAIFVLAAVFQYWRYPRRHREQIVKLRRKALARHGQGVMGEHELAITEEGLHEQTKHNTHLHRWSAVREAVTTPDGAYLLIVLTSGGAHAVPAAGVIEGDLAEFTVALGERVPVHAVDRGWRVDDVVRQEHSRLRAAYPIVLGLVAAALLYDPAWWVVDHALPDDLPYRLYYLVHAALLTLVPLIIVAYMVRRPRLEDTECRCRRCTHLLRGLSEPRCPECGEAI